jgi:hypothetical protein
MATAHHKRSDFGSGLGRPSYDPHAGPVVGDASYRLHFPDPESFRAAMALAAQLEAKGLSRRAWRVRWNIDGPQPASMPPPYDTTDSCGKPAAAVEPGAVRTLVESLGLSRWAISRRLGVAHHTVSSWFKNGGITPENFRKLQELCK